MIMSDYYATLKIQQGRLKAAMALMNVTTAAELSRLCLIGQAVVGQLLNFRTSPRKKNGEWKKSALAICKVLACDPAEIFPEHLEHEIETNQISTYVEQAQMDGRTPLQLSPFDECANNEATDIIDSVLSTLTDRESDMIRTRFFDGMTQVDASNKYGICRERARQIEEKALRKLRHPYRLNQLKDIGSSG